MASVARMGRAFIKFRMNKRRAMLALGLVLVGAAEVAVCAEPNAESTQTTSSAQALPGAADYAGHCASCHGAKLEGGVHAPPLTGLTFVGNWAGKRARLLYSRIISTMPQNDPGSLSVQQALSVTLYVFSANGIAWAGHTLSSPDDLNALTIPSDSSSQTPNSASSAPIARAAHPRDTGVARRLTGS
jgi:S-disulfanyl-L-cysteine oxidoreductase SoxD